MRGTLDVVVVGAGPAGCATALAHARSGRQVLLLEARRQPSARLAGEWLHPLGADVLRRLGLDPLSYAGTTPLGFALHPDDGSTPILLPCPRGGRAATFPHHRLVGVLREAVTAHRSVTLMHDARVTGMNGGTVTYTVRGGVEHRIRAQRVVGADGQASIVRRLSRPGPEIPAATVSRTAGLLLRDVRLPVEGYGHIFSGAPGAVLAYRLDDDTVRVTLDVPSQLRGTAQLRTVFDDAYAPYLPSELGHRLRQALEAVSVRWAANHVRPRVFYGAGSCALVGDAVGTCHPLTASGLTIALRDAESLSLTQRLDHHAADRLRAVRAHEHLAVAIHRFFSDASPVTVQLRRSMYEVLRTSADERERMMRLVCAEENTGASLISAVSRVAARALRKELLVCGARSAPVLRTCADYLSWLYWLTRVPHGATYHPPALGAVEPHSLPDIRAS